MVVWLERRIKLEEQIVKFFYRKNKLGKSFATFWGESGRNVKVRDDINLVRSVFVVVFLRYSLFSFCFLSFFIGMIDEFLFVVFV